MKEIKTKLVKDRYKFLQKEAEKVGTFFVDDTKDKFNRDIPIITFEVY